MGYILRDEFGAREQARLLVHLRLYTKVLMIIVLQETLAYCSQIAIVLSRKEL